MKNTILHLLACGSVAASAYAGHEVAHAEKGFMPPAEPCFHDREFHLDVFGSWIDTRSAGSGFGGGLGATYFFHRYVGLGVDANLADVSNGLWTTSSSLIGRYPLELGGVCIAPYALAGGGIQADGTISGTWHAGGGLEWRATPSFGVFSEGRYVWTASDKSEENVRVSVGLRIVF